MIRQSHEEYLKLLQEKRPELRLISEFKSYSKKVMVEDQDGILYYTSPRSLLDNKKITLINAYNKLLAYNIRIQKLFPNLTVLEVVQGNIKAKIKDELGIVYSVKPEVILRGHYPSIETATDKTKAFKIFAKQVHGDRYDYSLSVYIKDKQKLTIICPEHGEFYQMPNTHVHSKRGCLKCNKARGWKLDEWLEFTKNKNCIFYVLKCKTVDRDFIKCGISSKNINERYERFSHLPYDYEIIELVNGTGKEVWDLEKAFIEKHKENKFRPPIKFKGWTECFNSQILKVA